jgi:hypothetical protein
MENDEDKIFYTKIGKTEIQVDKVLTNLLNFEVRLMFMSIFRNG